MELSLPTRPNILCVVNEDSSPFLGAYGDTSARTPHLDRLARDGVRYSNCFSVAPVCAPSRFAMITGLYPTSCGPAQHMRAAGGIPDWLRGFPALLREAGYYCVNNSKTDYNAPIDPAATWDACDDKAHWRARPAGAPFFAVFNNVLSHESALFPGTRPAVPHITDPTSVRIPPYHPDTETMRRDRARCYDVMAATDDLVGERMSELAEDGLAEDTIVLHYSDHGCGLPGYKRFCSDPGLHVPLIICVPPRWAHLAPAGGGAVLDTPVSGVDIPPTVLSLAGVPVPPYLQGVAFAGPDRGNRTFAFSARDRMDERYDMQRTARDHRFRYTRNYAPHLPYGQHLEYMWQQDGVREWESLYESGSLSPTQARFWQEKPPEELYDLISDPDTIHNLAGSPTHRQTLQRMREALDEHLLAVNDNGFIPEGSAPEGYEASRAAGAYPLADVLRLAAVVIRRDPVELPEIVRHLRSPDETMRYWAAYGCVLLGPRARPAADTLRQLLLDDGSDQVRIAAAQALAQLGETDPSLRHLADALCHHPDRAVRLRAANALHNLGPVAGAVLESIERATGDSYHYIGRAATHTAAVLRSDRDLFHRDSAGR